MDPNTGRSRPSGGTTPTSRTCLSVSGTGARPTETPDRCVPVRRSTRQRTVSAADVAPGIAAPMRQLWLGSRRR